MRNLLLIAVFILVGTVDVKAVNQPIQDRTPHPAPVVKVETVKLEIEPTKWEPFDCEQARIAGNGRVCMACNIYHEARSESEPGQYAVGLVTYNRVRSPQYPNNICDVVYEARRNYKTKHLTPMFSWTLDGKSDKVYNKEKWYVAYSIANTILSSVKSGMYLNDITGGALYYHATYVTPVWARQMIKTIKIGRHIFYVDPAQIAQTN